MVGRAACRDAPRRGKGDERRISAPGSRFTMSEQPTAERALPYLINDADEHSTPNSSAYERYIDPDKSDMAIRIERTDGGRSNITLYNGRPARFTFTNFQVVGPTSSLPRSASRTSAHRTTGRPGHPGLAAHAAEPAEGSRRRRPQGFRQALPRAAAATRQPGRPARGDGRAGHPVRGELRGDPGHRGRVRRRLRRPLREPGRAQPLPRHRVGIQLRTAAVHPTVHLVRRSRRRARCCSKRS